MTDQAVPTSPTTMRNRADVDARLYGPAPKATTPPRNRSGISLGDVNGPGLIGWFARLGPGGWLGMFLAAAAVAALIGAGIGWRWGLW